MPRKSLRNKQKEIAAQQKLEKEKKKEREKKAKEKEFVQAQHARGLQVRNMLFQEGSEETIEAVVVYKIKEGWEDPFESDNMVYVQDEEARIVHQEKCSGDMKNIVEQFKNL